MDHQVLQKAKERLGPEYEEKVYLFNEFLGENTDVADPIRTRDFEQAYQDIDKGVQAILSRLIKYYHLKKSRVENFLLSPILFILNKILFLI